MSDAAEYLRHYFKSNDTNNFVVIVVAVSEDDAMSQFSTKTHFEYLGSELDYCPGYNDVIVGAMVTEMAQKARARITTMTAMDKHYLDA